MMSSDQSMRCWGVAPPRDATWSPGSTSTATPARPTMTPAQVTRCGRSPVPTRSSTTHSGTTATSRAATPVGT